jgi:hypothetical protein
VKRETGFVIAFTLLIGGARGAAAQETGTPMFQSPYRSFGRQEFGGTVSFLEGPQTGVEGHYRRGFGTLDVGVRLGAMVRDGAPDSFLAGLGLRVPVLHERHSPLRGALVTGVGLDIDDGVNVWVPVGISLGRRLLVEESPVRLVPFAAPTLFFTTLGDEAVSFALGLGLDLRLSPMFEVRVAGGFGTTGAPEGLAVSAVWLR